MGRKFNLMKESDKLLKLIRQGKSTTRTTRRREIRLCINDLVRLGIAPTSLMAINDRHIKLLVAHWKSQTLSLRTISNKLGIIRTFLKFAAPTITVPSNKMLGIQPPQKSTSKVLCLGQPDDLIKMAEHSCTRSILAFQMYLGLTKTEAIRINLYYSLNDDCLQIDRALAFNGKDRCIPIVSEQQKQVLHERQKILGENEKLTAITSESNLLALYKADLLIKGFDPNFPYRKYYAQARYRELSNNADRVQALRQLQSELGISSTHRMKAFL